MRLTVKENSKRTPLAGQGMDREQQIALPAARERSGKGVGRQDGLHVVEQFLRLLPGFLRAGEIAGGSPGGSR